MPDYLKSPRFLDRVEQVIVSALYVWFVARLWPDANETVILPTVFLLLSEGAVLAFILVRRSTDNISMRFSDWFVAAGGTFAVLLVGKPGAELFPQFGVVFLVSGMLIHIAAKFSLRRSFGLVAANRGVRKRGMYAFVRHPMYAGYMLTHMGFLLSAPTLRNALVYAVTWTFLILRIFAEERVLSHDPDYLALKKTTPYRLIPGIF